MFTTLTSLAGLRIDDERIKDFLEKNGFKYPKKPFISNRSTDTSYWIQNKKLGIDLLFSARNYNEKYPLIQGDKKGVWVPVLNRARWYNNKSKTEFPLNIDFGHDFETLKTKLGEPTQKSSDVSHTWLNDDGSESWYRWRLPLDNDRSIEWGLEFGDDLTINDFMVGLPYHSPVFEFYYEWHNENFDSFVKRKDWHQTAYLMFLQWTIDHNMVTTNENTAAVAKDIKEGKLPVTEYIKALNRGYMLEEDFSAEQRFIYSYIHNVGSYDTLFTRDVAHTFLKDDTLKDNYFCKEATEQLNAVEYNAENYAIVKSIIDNRLAEYKEHKFKQSKQL